MMRNFVLFGALCCFLAASVNASDCKNAQNCSACIQTPNCIYCGKPGVSYLLNGENPSLDAVKKSANDNYNFS